MSAVAEIIVQSDTLSRPHVAGEPYPRGYRAQLDPIAARRLKELHVTQFWRPAGRALLTHATAYALMLGFCWLATYNTALALLMALPAGILMAREMRVLELLVHNASHRNWSRNKALNDTASVLLCGLPMASSIAAYWESHRIHHHEYGSAKDPDRAGFEFLGPLDLNNRRAAFNWLIRYAIQYYRAIGASPIFLGAFLLWHGVVYILPLSLLVGPALAIGAWAALWLFPMLTFLSALRAIAEREEHDYELGSTEFSTTFTNIGCIHKILFHPWNDHYHLLHHLYAGIPQFNHAEAHQLLMRHDPEYRTCRARLSILGAPVLAKDVPAKDAPGQAPLPDAPRLEQEARPNAGDQPRKPALPDPMPRKPIVRLPDGLRTPDGPPAFARREHALNDGPRGRAPFPAD